MGTVAYEEAAAEQVLDPEIYLHSREKYWFFKRTQDIVLSALALLVLWPLMLITAIIIVVDDPHGGPIFKQKRIGRLGKEFTFYKFRSMRVNAESMLDELMEKNEMDGPMFKITDDPRITHFGKFIRKCSIDELPQLFNILKGDMTIVGPRPSLPREVEQFSDYQMQRLMVTPGLTCYWQVQPHRNDLSFDEWMELDIKYIKERNFILDWKLIFMTFGAIVGGNGR